MTVGDLLQFAKISGESHYHNPDLIVGKLPYLSEFSTSGDLPGAKTNISLSTIHFFFIDSLWPLVIGFNLQKDWGKAMNIINILW